MKSFRLQGKQKAARHPVTASGRPGVVCRAITLREVRRLEPIESGFETDHVFRLQCERNDAGFTWVLREETLPRPYVKHYDSGHVGDWLTLYTDSAKPEDFCFVAALVGERVEGFLTWRYLRWNHTVWLVDIRTRREARRMGIGSALVDHVKQVARKRKARGISVETQINNYPAICFYRKHCFEVAGFNDHLYTNDDLRHQDVALSLFWEAT